MEAYKAIIEFDKFSFIDRLKFLYTGKLKIAIHPDEEIDGYEVKASFGCKDGKGLPKQMFDALDF